MKDMYVLDTNILLSDANSLYSFGGKIVVLPEIVLDELDSKKSGQSELAYQAREVGRIISKCSLVNVVKVSDHVTEELVSTTTKLELDDIEIHIVSKSKYHADADNTSPSILNDRKIIEVAKDIGATLYSNDVMCRIRATSLGVVAKPYEISDDKPLTLFREAEISDEVYDSITDFETVDIKELVPDHLNETKAYRLYTPYGRHVLATVLNNNRLSVVDEAELQRQEAAPLNLKQKLLSHAILSRQYDLIITDSRAGSGKNVTAMSAAMKLVRKKFFNKIYYIRNTVNNLERAEEVGFLAGNEEKFAPYFAPMYDTLRFFAEKTFKSGKVKQEEIEKIINEKIDEYAQRYNIEAMSTLGIRGRTLQNCIVIIDEVQNLSASSLQTLLTRIGDNTIVIMLGSSNQIDNTYISRYNNGIAVLKNDIGNDHGDVSIFSVTMEKVVRGKVTEYAEKVFTKIKD